MQGGPAGNHQRTRRNLQTAWEHAQLFKTPFRRTDRAAAYQREVSRVLTAKFELGLFENPYTPLQRFRIVFSRWPLKTGCESSPESIVLLKTGMTCFP